MTARIQSPTPTALRRMATVLKRGGLVAVPSETVYGLAAHALDAKACQRIFKAKGRPSTDPLIVHVHSLAAAAAVADLTPEARALGRAFWPGPLTLVLKKKAIVPDVVTSGLDSVAVRIPRHRVFRDLLRVSALPLAAPSANPFGYISPTTAEHVLHSLGDRIEHILDGGACEVGVESTIVDLRNPAKPCVLRPGKITADEIAAVLGVPVTVRRGRSHPGKTGKKRRSTAQRAPGQLERHYSPATRLRWVKAIASEEVLTSGRRVAYLFVVRPADPRLAALGGRVAWLSEAGDATEAARVLFARLRGLDQGGYREIRVERLPDDPAYAVIADRLNRAAARGR